ncbi:unnamed protein product [Prunus armeniaca]|uniref:Uncharacterized protein n=1 Tax=Prunus armeniaca TaxID=36596 RepID=A0A6J5U5P4_PRUAR|nr:unnamed protein product [Prunus armeniaca]
MMLHGYMYENKYGYAMHTVPPFSSGILQVRCDARHRAGHQQPWRDAGLFSHVDRDMAAGNGRSFNFYHTIHVS